MNRDQLPKEMIQALVQGSPTTVTMSDGKEVIGYIDMVGPEHFTVDDFGNIYKGLISDVAAWNGEAVKENL